MKTITAEAEINGINIHYRIYGEGEPLLLIAGLSGNSDWWDPRFLELLAERFQVITFDNRGAGRSDVPEGPYTISQMASDAAGLLEHLGLESAHVLGHSLGGMIAQEMAVTYPEKIRRLILLCTNCGGKEQVYTSKEVYAVLTAPRKNLTPEEIVRGSLFMLFPQEYMDENPEEMDEMVRTILIAPIKAKGYIAQFTAANTWSIYSRLPDLRHHTLIIVGGKDILIPPENSRIIADKIPDCHLVEFPEAGHQIMSMFPDEVAREVLDFLA